MTDAELDEIAALTESRDASDDWPVGAVEACRRLVAEVRRWRALPAGFGMYTCAVCRKQEPGNCCNFPFPGWRSLEIKGESVTVCSAECLAKIDPASVDYLY